MIEELRKGRCWWAGELVHGPVADQQAMHGGVGQGRVLAQHARAHACWMSMLTLRAGCCSWSEQS